jgi:hypothetical protein
VTESEREALALALDSELPYQGLRGLAPSPNLLLYLPAALARTAELVPLSLEDNVLRLACTRPDVDVSPIRARFPRLALELAISTPEDVGQMLASMREAAA